MKTLFALFSIAALVTATQSLDASQWDAGELVSALAVAALFVIALNDSRQPERSLIRGRIESYPAPSRVSRARGANSMDLAA